MTKEASRELLQDPRDEEGAAAERQSSVLFRFPVRIGYTDFHLRAARPLESLTTVAAVPTAEIAIPLAEQWTLLPFLGVGGGWLIEEHEEIWILTMGARAEWTHEIDEPLTLRVLPRLRYDANLNRPDGLLGDWGRIDLAVELRRAFGSADDAVRFEPGVYAQGFWFWDDIEFDVPGLNPESVNAQAEFGLSLGTRGPVTILGIELPRVFVGYRFGDGIETFGIRFGEL